jgi:hypothetical protein
VFNLGLHGAIVLYNRTPDYNCELRIEPYKDVSSSEKDAFILIFQDRTDNQRDNRIVVTRTDLEFALMALSRGYLGNVVDSSNSEQETRDRMADRLMSHRKSRAGE